MNEIAKQHNDLIDLPLRRFNASEIDILNAICYRCQEKETKEVVLHFYEIKQLSHYQAKDEKQLIEAIDNTNKKLIELNFKVGTEEKFIRFALFPTFEIDARKGTVTVQVHEKFAYLLNELSGNYTSLELQESAQLKSAYAKAIYKKLRKYRDTGTWRVTLTDFREYLDIPKSYKIGDLPLKIIRPSIVELAPFFDGLSYETEYRKKAGRGRPAVSGYVFTFKPQPHKEKPQITQESIAKQTGWQKTQFYCPMCHRPVFRKMLEKENGTYPLYGHTDFKTGNCDFTTFDSADLLRKEHLPAPELTEKQKENKAKLAGIIGGLFKK